MERHGANTAPGFPSSEWSPVLSLRQVCRRGCPARVGLLAQAPLKPLPLPEEEENGRQVGQGRWPGQVAPISSCCLCCLPHWAMLQAPSTQPDTLAW